MSGQETVCPISKTRERQTHHHSSLDQAVPELRGSTSGRAPSWRVEAVWVLRAEVLQEEGASSEGLHPLRSSVWTAVGVGEGWRQNLVQEPELELKVALVWCPQASDASPSCSAASHLSAWPWWHLLAGWMVWCLDWEVVEERKQVWRGWRLPSWALSSGTSPGRDQQPEEELWGTVCDGPGCSLVLAGLLSQTQVVEI